MQDIIYKKSFTIKGENYSYLDMFKNKSKFVNDALSFYISYLEKVNIYKENLIEDKIKEALGDDFYKIDVNNIKKTESNIKNYINSSKKLEENILLAINEK